MLSLDHCDISRFADGEIQVEIHESVRGCNVFLIQSTNPPVNENYMESFMILDALKRASAAEITLVMPYYRLRPSGSQSRSSRADFGKMWWRN